MSDYWDKRERFELVGTLTVSGATPVVKTWGHKVDVKRFILVTTTAQTVANDTVTLAKRKVDDTSSENVGSFVATFSGSALNDIRFVDVGKPDEDVVSGTVGDQYGRTASIIHDNGPGLLRVEADEEIVLTPAAGATAGAYQVYVQFQDLGFNPKDIEIAVDELTYTPA